MKPFSCLAFVLLCLFMVPLSALLAQGNPVMEITYMRVPPGGEENYISLEHDIWKPIHQKRLEENCLLGWYVLQVELPRGVEADYNFVVINIFPSIADLDNPFTGVIWADIHPHLNASSLTEKTLQAREVVRTEIFELIDEAVPGQPDVMPRFIAVNMMKTEVADMDDYERLERQIWKPVHLERIRQQQMEDWMLLRRILPNGASTDYNYITWDAYASYLDFYQNASEETFKRVHPNRKLSKMLHETNARRVQVNQQMWSVVDYLFCPHGPFTSRQ